MVISKINKIRILQKITSVFLILFCVFLFFQSLNWEDNKKKEVIFVLDISKSMDTKDVKYQEYNISRLESVQKIIKNTIKEISNDTQVWLIIFSKKWLFLIPPTLDIWYVDFVLDTINTSFWKDTQDDILAWIKLILPSKDIIKNIYLFTDWYDFGKVPKIKTNWINRNIIWIWSESISLDLEQRLSKKQISDLSKSLNWNLIFLDEVDEKSKVSLNFEKVKFTNSNKNIIFFIFWILCIFLMMTLWIKVK